MMKKVEEEEKPAICDFCDDTLQKPASNTCINCSASYCETHFATKHHLHDQRKHVLIPPTCRRSDYVCLKHDEVVRMFCQVEQKALCMLCMNLGTHKEHHVVDIDVATKEKKTVLQADLDYLENAIATSEAEVNNLIGVSDKVKAKAQIIKDNIKHANDGAKLELEKNEQELMEQVIKEEDNFSTKVNCEIYAGVQNQEMLTNIKSKINAVLECTFPIVFLKRYQDLESNRRPSVRKSLMTDLENKAMEKWLNIERMNKLRVNEIIYHAHPDTKETSLLDEHMNSLKEQNEVWTIPLQSLQIKNEIYTGSHTKVFPGNFDGSEVFIKQAVQEQCKLKFIAEASVMKNLQHPRILRLFGIVTIDPYMIVTELMEKGDLQKFLRSPEGKISHPVMNGMLLQVAEGMSFMQRKGYIHTDLRASNVLLDDKLNCKISGLHDARQTLGKEFYFREGHRLPIRWTAVETLKTSLFTSKSDVWSFGIVITELYSYGVLPYIGKNHKEVMDLVTRGECIDFPSDCPERVCTVVQMCTRIDPCDRPSFKKLCADLEKIIKSDQ